MTKVDIHDDATLVGSLLITTAGRSRESLIVCPFSRTRDLEIETYPLPDEEDPVTRLAFAATVAWNLNASGPPSSVFMIVCTSQTYGDPLHPVGDKLVYDLGVKLHDYDTHTSGAFCVAADGWGEYWRTNRRDPRCGPKSLDLLTTPEAFELARPD
jgi:hypothetical protein